jgi:hypothetical protein
MHATVITSRGLTRQLLEREVMLRARGNPGFVAGCWLSGNKGEHIALVVYKDEHDARVAASPVVSAPGAEVARIEVCEVPASAEAS